MRWPWGKQSSKLRLSIRYGETQFAYVLSEPADGQSAPLQVLKWGAVTAPANEADGLHKAVRALGLEAGEVLGLLDPAQYQILKVDTPNVPAEELKAAARWQIKELVDVHLDDLTLDVMHVGGDVAGDGPRAQRQLFVVAARNSVISSLSAQCQAAELHLSVVDTWETALRNLQTQQAETEQLQARATAALLMLDEQCLLTISVAGELYYTRRLDADPRLEARAMGKPAAKPQEAAPLGFEYQPGNGLSGMGDDSEESVLIIELQRSIDLWERSWPELPLARLYLLAPQHGAEVAALLQRELGLRTLPMDLGAIFSGLELSAGQTRADLGACLPLLGAALRLEPRAL